jgi:CheY-like chemotaxis protein
MAKLGSVLIVDDNPRCLEFMRLAFEAQGVVNVTSELSAVEALKRLRVERPDLVILDVKMPERDGFAVLAMLRAEGNRVPVVMCSGASRQKDVDRAYAGGCNGYFEKPTILQDDRTLAGAIVDYWRLGELPSQ